MTYNTLSRRLPLRWALTACALLLGTMTVSAARAKGGWFTHTQPDGQQITLTLRGDEWFHYYETPSGQVYMPNAEGRMLRMEPAEVQRQAARARQQAPRRLPPLVYGWDASQELHSPVVLVEFADRTFSMENPRERYDSIFNQPGYNEGKGPGCVADYFRDQSAGLCNIVFDVYGPVKVSTKAKANGTYGQTTFRTAFQALVDSLGEQIAWGDMDWNSDGQVQQVVFIYAGYGGNESDTLCTNCIWPNTSSFSQVQLPSGHVASTYTASAELWSNNKLCGIGTICHEFSHSIGLPDLYPTSGSKEYSVVDEWDLMDGGNFINNGWCPVGYSAHEKMLLGWLSPEPLDTTTHVGDMLPASEGGTAYVVKHTDSEFFLLENRQWTGWDLLAPGHGLLISHVDYNESTWRSNAVNNREAHHRYDLVHADNRTYNDWALIFSNSNPRKNGHNRILSGSPYPYVDASEDSTVNNQLTDTSVPAAVTFAANDGGEQLLSKPITNITETAEGRIAFDFMDQVDTGMGTVMVERRQKTDAVYDLGGRRTTGKGIVMRNGKKLMNL